MPIPLLLIVRVMFALSLTVCEIFANYEKCQKFDLENLGLGQGIAELDLGQSTGNVGIHIGIFRILAIWEQTLTQKVTHGHIHKARNRGEDNWPNLQSRFSKNNFLLQ